MCQSACETNQGLSARRCPTYPRWAGSPRTLRYGNSPLEQHRGKERMPSYAPREETIQIARRAVCLSLVDSSLSWLALLDASRKNSTEDAHRICSTARVSQ